MPESLTDMHRMHISLRNGDVMREHVEHDPTFPYPTRYIELIEPRMVYVGDHADGARYRLKKVREASILDFENISEVGGMYETVTEYPHEAQLSVFSPYREGHFDEARQEIIREGRYVYLRTVFWSESLTPPEDVPDEVMARLRDEAAKL